jgi:hypothetical protein
MDAVRELAGLARSEKRSDLTDTIKGVAALSTVREVVDLRELEHEHVGSTI